MKAKTRLASTLFAAAVASAPVALALVASPPANKSAAAMAEAATRFLASLDAEQTKLAHHPWEAADRTSFVYVPKARSGAPLKILKPEQRKLAHDLLKTGLSQAGFTKASQIIDREKILAEIEKNPVRRDPELYYFWVFGKPEANGTWGWKAEGHHLSFNFTVIKGTVVANTPNFAGVNPAEVRDGPLKGNRILRVEEDLARELVTSFDEKARAQVVFDAKAPTEILTAQNSQAEVPPLVGVEVGKMNAKQKEMVRKLLAEYAGMMTPALAKERLSKIDKSGFDKLRFGWAGGLKKGEQHYYRIQGPTVLIEWDNSQNDGNHIHATWRDFNGDFGRDLLREHLKAAHNAP
jgi:hypothetical protein